MECRTVTHEAARDAKAVDADGRVRAEVAEATASAKSTHNIGAPDSFLGSLTVKISVNTHRTLLRVKCTHFRANRAILWLLSQGERLTRIAT